MTISKNFTQDIEFIQRIKATRAEVRFSTDKKNWLPCSIMLEAERYFMKLCASKWDYVKPGLVNLEIKIDNQIFVSDDANIISVSDSHGSEITIELNNFSNDLLIDSEIAYFRSIIRAENTTKFYDKFQTSGYKHVQSYCSDLIEIKTSGFGTMYIFLFQQENQKYIIVDSEQELNLPDFLHSLFSIHLAIALLSGTFDFGITHVFAYFDKNFENQKSKSIVALKKSVRQGHQCFNIDPYAYEIIPSAEKQDWSSKLKPFTQSQFSRLVDLLLTNEYLLSTVIIIVDIPTYTLENQLPLYGIALEAIAAHNKDKRKNAQKKPIMSKDFALRLQRRLQEVIIKAERCNHDPNNDFEPLKKRIENINQPTNRDTLEETFSLNNISLNVEDKRVIEYRNKLLHGHFSMLYRSETDYMVKANKLWLDALRLHLLIARYLLSQINYDGYLVNLTKMQYDMDNPNASLNEEFFIEVELNSWDEYSPGI